VRHGRLESAPVVALRDGLRRRGFDGDKKAVRSRCCELGARSGEVRRGPVIVEQSSLYGEVVVEEE
jgi:hypothetical protein